MTDLTPGRLPIYTIGHSNRSLQEFMELLRAPQVECVVDVRKMPMSRTKPQFNSDVLSDALLHHHIAYRRLDALGGLRSKARTIPFELNAFWKNRSFHNYADYALSDTFHEGLSDLVQHGQSCVCAIMCSEAV